MPLKYLVLLFISFGLIACQSQQASSDDPSSSHPNILFILADDLGYEKVSSYGGLEVKTPNIDALAEGGTRFTRAYTSPVCTPSRMSIYTGLYAPNHGYTQVIPIHQGSKHAVNFRQMPTFPQLLHDAGYYTAVTGKWQLAALEFHPEHCRDAGFDSWCVWQIWKDEKKTKRYWDHTYNQDGAIQSSADSIFGPDLMANYVIDQMAKAKAQKQPFYIHHNMVLPHVPIVSIPSDLQSEQEASLDNMIQYMDGIVGKLSKAVDSLGLGKNTYIIFAGDNGTQSKIARQTNAGEVNGGKWELNDAGIHVPLIIKSPQKNNAFVNDDLIDFADFFPTICEIANVSIPGNIEIDGWSFQESINGNRSKQRSWVSAAINHNFIVFDGQWRLHHKENKLVDCRALPAEQVVVDTNSAGAVAALKSLSPIVEAFRVDFQVQKMY